MLERRHVQTVQLRSLSGRSGFVSAGLTGFMKSSGLTARNSVVVCAPLSPGVLKPFSTGLSLPASLSDMSGRNYTPQLTTGKYMMIKGR